MANRIEYAGITFTDDPEAVEQILDGNCFMSIDLPGDELPFDTLEVTLRSLCLTYIRLVPSGSTGLRTADGKILKCRYDSADLTKYVYGTPVYFYHNDELIGKFYVLSLRREGRTSFLMKCVSAVGLLDRMPHNGGIYSGQTFGAILEDIVGGVIDYTVDSSVADIPMYGWLPADTRRANLHQLLFAVGASITKSAEGTIHISFIPVDTAVPIDDDRLYIEGDIEYTTPATGADVTEHAYVALDSDDVKTLFDNTDGSGEAVGQRIVFDAPHHDLVATGNLAIIESGPNHAILTGTGILTGKTYTHQQKIISHRLPAAGAENIAVVDDMTLVSLANSENVAARTLSFYAHAKRIAADLKVGAERPGAYLSFSDPFDEAAEAFLASMYINISRTLRATATFISGYVPTVFGNNYKNKIVISASGYWISPITGVIRYVLISGGQGGESGEYGETASGNFTTLGKAGNGGAAGVGGSGGKILTGTMTVTEGQAIPVVIGLGGAGGVADPGGKVAGMPGGATTFGGMSSEDGTVSAQGVTDIFTGDRFAYPGETGIPGGRGSDSDAEGPAIVVGENTYYPGKMGEEGSYGSQAGGSGGYGGGAANGANGNGGGDGSGEYNEGHYWGEGGHGGDGADAADGNIAVNFGVGGGGGSGGGGGGAGGNAYNRVGGSNYLAYGDPGRGGAGGNGGDGAPGIVIIYF